MTFSRVNWIALGKAEAEIWDTKRGGGTICRKNRPVDRTEHDLVTEIGDFLLPSTSFFADPRFLGFSRPTCALKPVCTHLRIYNNVTHTPRVRLFLLFRPVARGACLRGVGVVPTVGEMCQIAAISGLKVKDMEPVITALSSLQKRFVKPKSCKLYLHFSLFQQCKFCLLYTVILTWRYPQEEYS